MAEEHTEESREESGQSNGHHLGRAAVIAAASGATAYAARKALSGRPSGQGNSPKSDEKRGEGSASLVTSAIASGWDVAKDSLIPVVEDAAAKAGTFVAERSPEVVRDVVVPRFIAGFERGRRKSEKSET
jgi:hypothetical protein